MVLRKISRGYITIGHGIINFIAMNEYRLVHPSLSYCLSSLLFALHSAGFLQVSVQHGFSFLPLHMLIWKHASSLQKKVTLIKNYYM